MRFLDISKIPKILIYLIMVFSISVNQNSPIFFACVSAWMYMSIGVSSMPSLSFEFYLSFFLCLDYDFFFRLNSFPISFFRFVLFSLFGQIYRKMFSNFALYLTNLSIVYGPCFYHMKFKLRPYNQTERKRCSTVFFSALFSIIYTVYIWFGW